jgi:hypothetical protein
VAHRWRAAPIHETFAAAGEETVATDTNHLLDRVGFGEVLLDAREHPALALWHIGNEYACHVSACYCDESARAFRGWLLRILIDEAGFLLREREAPRNYQDLVLTETPLSL